jgi:hypothetical protein
MAQVTVDTVVHLQDFGLERLDVDRAIVGFAKKAEGKRVRWLDFAKGALLFLMVPGTMNPEPSTSTTAPGRPSIRSRSRSSSVTAVFGKRRFESLTGAFDLVALARNPRVLRA